MFKFSRIAMTSLLALATLGNPVWADGHETGLARQADSLIDNTLKAFAYDWYARFDNGTTIDEIAPNLPDTFEFVYPQATLTTLDELAPQFEAAWAATNASAHEIEEVFVHPTAEADLYEVVTPHTYYISRKDGTFGEIDIVGRMRVRLGLTTERDPSGELPKIENYVVLFEGAGDNDVTDTIKAKRIGGISDNDAKSFVHQWFAATDARDAAAMIARTSDGPLNVNLLGTEIGSKAELQAYLEANSAVQSWAIHQPHNISVTPTDEGFAVRFIVHFEGDIEGVGTLKLTNVTNWLLVEEDGALRLRDYSLTIL